MSHCCVWKLNFENKRFNTHRPHFPALSICCDVVLWCSWSTLYHSDRCLSPSHMQLPISLSANKKELAYTKEQLVRANKHVYWAAKVSALCIRTFGDMLELRFWPLRTSEQPCCLNPTSLFIAAPPVLPCTLKLVEFRDQDEEAGSINRQKEGRNQLRSFPQGALKVSSDKSCHTRARTHSCKVQWLLGSISGMIKGACGRETAIDLNANSLSPDRMKRRLFGGKHAAPAVADWTHWGKILTLVNKN